MSSKVGDPEARRGEPQMGNPTRGSEKYTRLPRHARRISTFTIGGEKYTRLPRQSWMGTLTIGLRNFLSADMAVYSVSPFCTDFCLVMCLW